MADVREMRIFSADQIEVPQDLPAILKDFSKEVIRSNPKDLVKFSREYFENKMNERNAQSSKNEAH
jgi:hypothetical protein